MTLTAVLPSLRQSLPDPLDPDLWPEHTVARRDDIVVAGVSLVRLAELCTTPCVHTAAAAVPGGRGRASSTEVAAVVIASVTAVLGEGADRRVALDAEITGCASRSGEARLLGRVSRSTNVPWTVVGRASANSGAAYLPRDLQPGDLVAIPCQGSPRRRDIMPEIDFEEPVGRCAR